MERSALLLIEFQNEWISKDGKLHHLMQDEDLFSNSLDLAEQVLNAARKTNMEIIHSGLEFNFNYKELGQAKAGLRCHIKKNKPFLKGAKLTKFANSFAPIDGEFVVSGRLGSSAFAGSNLDLYLRSNRITKLFIMGYALHVCVESTMRAAHDLGYDVCLIEDACSAFTQQQQKYVIDNIVPHFGECLSSKEFIEIIKN
jgi:nicotinamidase-related amidase